MKSPQSHLAASRRDSIPSVTARLTIRVVAYLAFFVGFMAQSTRPASAADWNDVAIQWRPWAKALAEAKAHQKPICLVFYTNWCGHCRNYSKVFHAREVVEASRRFVMVRLNRDANPRLSRRFAIDGDYIPRTYFLSPDGVPDPRIHADRDDFKYFYDEDDPASLLAAMRAASRSAPP